MPFCHGHGTKVWLSITTGFKPYTIPLLFAFRLRIHALSRCDAVISRVRRMPSCAVLTQAGAAAAALEADAKGRDGGWAAAARRGLYSVLVSRTGAEQRHAALRLTAAVLELSPVSWLMGPAPPLVHPYAAWHHLASI